MCHASLAHSARQDLAWRRRREGTRGPLWCWLDGNTRSRGASARHPKRATWQPELLLRGPKGRRAAFLISCNSSSSSISDPVSIKLLLSLRCPGLLGRLLTETSEVSKLMASSSLR